MRACFSGALMDGAADLAARLQHSGALITVLNGPDIHQALEAAEIPHEYDPDMDALVALLGQSNAGLGVLVGGLGEYSLGGLDVGTHALVRAAAVHYEHICVVVDAEDFEWLLDRVLPDGGLSLSQKQKRDLAAKAFRKTAALDSAIADQLSAAVDEKVAVLVVGGGGREHAIAAKLAESDSVARVFVAPGNGGTATASQEIQNVDVSVKDEAALVRFAQEKDIGLVVVGPEEPLTMGLADAMSAVGIPCFGPSAQAARLEASKAFSKDFMSRHGIPTARYASFTNFEAAEAHVRALDYQVVVKASGLAAGKGVVLPDTTDGAIAALRSMMLDTEFGDAGTEVVIEERLWGQEVSVLAFCDGTRAICMPAAQDHKRIFEGDKGLNTGGMGAYAPAPCLTDSLQKEAQALVELTVRAMAQEGTPYAGVLYLGLMLTSNGPRVLEYNCRFGDPETQVLLPLLDTDLYEICMACVNGTLSQHSVAWKPGFAANVVAAAPGYPRKYPKGLLISGLEAAANLPDCSVFHAGTRATISADGGNSLVTSGGRVLSATGYGEDLRSALSHAYAALDRIHFEGMHFRRDIGWRALARTADRIVLVIGGGGREHAVAVKLAESTRVRHVYVCPGNGGTNKSHSKISNESVNIEDHDAVCRFARQKEVSLVVVGPEDPLVKGITDSLTAAGVPCFGPSKAAARLEASKAFSKDFMTRHGIPTARFKTFTDFGTAEAFVREVDYPVVVKASGLAAGKGVVIPDTVEEAVAALRSMMLDSQFGTAGSKVVVEERLVGEEVSCLAFCDGSKAVAMPGAQDHKRVFDGDRGLNTGGMGAYAPAPCLNRRLKQEAQELLDKTVAAMGSEGSPYIGVLYMGLMLTPDGPKVLEYNCRFGDPETQVLMPLLDSDLYDICFNCVHGALGASPVVWRAGCAATVVSAAPGYPQSYPKGFRISGLSDAMKVPRAFVYHAGTKEVEEGSIVTSGGRVLAVTGMGPSLRSALAQSYAAMRQIHFDGMHFRRDIGHRALAMPLRLGVLGSTRGTTMQFLLDKIAAGELNAEVVCIVSNKSDAGILDKARNHGISATFVSAKGRSRASYDMEVSTVLEEHDVELVLLIGYMRILSPAFVAQWRNRCLNVHPSLLPDFAGGMDLAVHEAVIAAGRKESGCTVHFVTEELDGGPIAVQLRTAVEEGETPQSLKAKVQPLESLAFMEAVEKFRVGDIGPGANESDGETLGLSYKDAGVDIDAGNLLVERIKPACKATRRPGCNAALGGFGGLFDLDAAGYGGEDTILVGATDGVGTKLRIAQTTGIHDYVGIDLVAMCVNDLIVAGAEPLFFLDYYATGALDVDSATKVVKGIAEGCLLANCGLIGGETAEMPSMYNDSDYDLAGFAVGAMKRGDTLPKDVQPGDELIGLTSSGVHSNGFSLVRKIVERSSSDYDAPAPFDSSKKLGEALLQPTRIYVRLVMPLVKAGLVKAMAHITGGGLPENLPRILPKGVVAEIDIAKAGWTLPPVFRWLATEGNLAQEEMLRTFNSGIGFVLIVDPENIRTVHSILEEANEDFLSLGSVRSVRDGEEHQVVVHGRLLV